MQKNCLRSIMLSLALVVPLASFAKTVNLQNRFVNLGFSPKSGAANIVLDAIHNSKINISLAAFVITSDDIFNALVEAHNRGVDIRVVVDAKSAHINGSEVQALIDADIPVKLNNEFRIMHNKYIIIDNKSVQTGSFNYSSSADKKNAENVLFLENQPEIAKIYSENFEKLYANSKKISNNFENENSNFNEFSFSDRYLNKMELSELAKIKLKKDVADVAFSNACNYIPASPSAKNLILQVIKNAQKNIYMAAYDFSDPDIINALKDRQNNGVELNIVLDYKANQNNTVVQDLENLGAKVNLNKKFSIMHNKYIIIDNKTLEMGSFNYTTSAEMEQCNNIIVFYNQESLINNYMTDWNMLYDTSIKN